MEPSTGRIACQHAGADSATATLRAMVGRAKEALRLIEAGKSDEHIMINRLLDANVKCIDAKQLEKSRLMPKPWRPGVRR